MNTQKGAATGLSAALRSLDVEGKRFTKAGLAREIGVTRSAIQGWEDKLPVGRLQALVRLTGLAPEVLRPDYREAFQRDLGIDDPDSLFRVKRKPPQRKQ